jgi:hypothetical protein
MAVESNRNRGAALAAAASGMGWTLLADMAEYWRVNSSWSVPLRVRVRGCRSLSCPTVAGALVDYGKRSLAEVAMFRYKKVIGRTLHARTLPTQKTEAKVACKVINIMTGLGMPVSRRIA